MIETSMLTGYQANIMTKPKKILFVSRIIPYPAKGGDLIVLEHITRALSAMKIEADLLCFGSCSSNDFFDFKNIYYCPIEPKINFRCLFDWFFKQKSYIFNRFYSNKLSEKLMELIKTDEYSTIIFEHSYMYVNLLFNPDLMGEVKKRGIKTIINAHVLEYFVFQQKYKYNKAYNLFTKIEQKYLKKIELECIKNADKTIFLSKEDMSRTANEIPEVTERFHLLEMIPCIENYTYSPPELEGNNSIYFMGTFSWIQNYDAVFYFVNEIFPLILEKNPDIKFYLVGKNANKKIKNLHNGKNIFFVGEKDNIFKEIKKYSVLVVPLRLKGGTRIKILESIAWGKAIVSTPAGMEGVNSNEDCPVIIAEYPEIFAEKVVELVLNDYLRVQIKQNSRYFAEKYYSFKEFSKLVFDIIYL